MRQKTSRRLIRRPRKLQREYGRKLRAICKFFGIPTSKGTLTTEEALEVLRKLGCSKAGIEYAARVWKDSRWHYEVYVPYRIVGIWPKEDEDEA